MVRWVLLFRECGDVEHVGEFCKLCSSQWLGEQVGEIFGSRDVLQCNDLVGNLILEMVVPNIYAFPAFGGCAVVADLDGCVVVDVEWRRSLWREGVTWRMLQSQLFFVK